MLADRDNERRILSAMTHSEHCCIEALTQLEKEDFTFPLYGDLFELIKTIYEDGAVPTNAVVMREGTKYNFINGDNIDDINYAISDSDYIGGENIQYWLNEITSSTKRRCMKDIVAKYENLIDSPAEKVDDLLSSAIGELSLVTSGKQKSDFKDGQEIADQLEIIIKEKEAKFIESGATGDIILDGITTGFKKLDEVTLGFKAGDLIVLAAATGHGKSAFALQTAKTISIDRPYSLLYVNTEMNNDMVYMRLASNIAEIPFRDLRQGNTTGKRSDITKAIEKIRKSKFIYKFAPDLTPTRSIMEGRKAKIQKHIDMMIIDYIGRMEKFDPRQQEWQVLEQIVKTQKILAQELKIPIMILAQLNDDGSLQGAKRIKNECDMLLKLYPLTDEEIQKYNAKYVNANYRLNMDKNRDGEANLNIPIHFDKQIQRLESATPRNNYQQQDNLYKRTMQTRDRRE